MRTIFFLRWVNGLRAMTPGLTVTAPVPARSGTTRTTPAPGGKHAAPAPHDRARSLGLLVRKGSSPACGTLPTTGNGTVPTPASSTVPTPASSAVPTAASGVTGCAAGPVGDLRTSARPAVPVDAMVRCGAPHPAAGPVGAPLSGFLPQVQPAL
ncbi:hypothetical protein ABR737_16990 [Streptomyces sp. Edi2]|uniref:hypothetical protein n=1 Tax=Streptomyces sp. Edi2 TaxID=3162528 RepID=UPI003305F5F1